MSGTRKDPKKAKDRRERIRQQKHSSRTKANGAPPPEPEQEPEPLPHPAEQAMRDIRTMLDGHELGSVDAINARIAEVRKHGHAPDPALLKRQSDPVWRAQDMAYEAEDGDDPAYSRELIRKALELDPNCLDAQRLHIVFNTEPREKQIDELRAVLAQTEEKMGAAYFEENTGKFWVVKETRPYMRVRQQLADWLLEQERWPDAAAVLKRTLELHYADSHGVRFTLLSVYLAIPDLEAAGELLHRYAADVDFVAPFAYAAVLERWLASGEAEADAALARARKVNRYAEGYLTGAKDVPAEPPDYDDPRGESGGIVCAQLMAIAWRTNPAFLTWLAGKKGK